MGSCSYGILQGKRTGAACLFEEFLLYFRDCFRIGFSGGLKCDRLLHGEIRRILFQADPVLRAEAYRILGESHLVDLVRDADAPSGLVCTPLNYITGAEPDFRRQKAKFDIFP